MRPHQSSLSVALIVAISTLFLIAVTSLTGLSSFSIQPLGEEQAASELQELIFEFQPSATSVTDCMVITLPDVYYLQNDIVNSTNSTCIDIQSNDVYLDCQGYTVDGIDTIGTYGVSALGRTNVTVYNCTVTDWGNGIRLGIATNSFIQYNNLSSNRGRGIVYDGSFTTISNNIISSTLGYVSGGSVTSGIGISVSGSNPGNTFANNVAYSNDQGINFAGGVLNGNITNNSMYNNTFNLAFSSSSSVTNFDMSNTVDGKPVYYYYNNASVGTVPSDAGTILAVNSAGLVVQGLTLQRNSQGIWLVNTNNSVIDSNTLRYNSIGLSMPSGCWYNNITNNTITGDTNTNRSSTGISLGASSNFNNISNNTIYNHNPRQVVPNPNNMVGRGLSVSTANNNTFTNNIIYSNAEGILVTGSATNNNISDNYVYSNTKYGLRSTAQIINYIANNTFTNNAGFDIYDQSVNAYAIGDNVCNSLYHNVPIFVTDTLTCSRISNCTRIDRPGVYTLTTDLLNIPDSNLVRPVYAQDLDGELGDVYPACIDIASDNVVLNCDEHTIDGIDSNKAYGIQIDAYAYPPNNRINVTISNCTVTDWTIGLNTGGVILDDVTITNNTVNSNIQQGILAYRARNNLLISNNTLQENGNYDLDVYWDSSIDCFIAATITNNLGSGNRPIEFYNHTVNLQDSVLSELILCAADDSTIDNVTIIGSDTLDNNGLISLYSQRVVFTSINSSNNRDGMQLWDGNKWDNVVRDSIFNNNAINGIVSGTNNLTVINTTANGNTEGLSGILSSTAVISNNTFKENTRNDFDLYPRNSGDCATVTITNNTGSGDRPIGFYNTGVNLQNQVFSGLILCDADYSNMTNVTVLGSSTLDNNGLFSYYVNYVTFTNVTSSDNYIGLELDGDTNNVISGGTYSSNAAVGIFIGYGTSSSNNLITSVVANSNDQHGLITSSNWANTVYNNTFSENAENDIWIETQSSCAVNVTSNAGSGGRPIAYYANGPVNLQNQVFSELILCNADSSTLNNVTIDGSSTSKNNGLYTGMTSSSTFTNITSSNNYYGLHMSECDNNVIADSVFSSNNYSGVFSQDGITSLQNHNFTNVTANYNTYGFVIGGNGTNITNSFANNNQKFGIDIVGCMNNILNVTASSNSLSGIASINIFADTPTNPQLSVNNTITNSTMNYNSKYGIYVDTGNSNTFLNNTISFSQVGIYVVGTTISSNLANSRLNRISTNTVCYSADSDIYLNKYTASNGPTAALGGNTCDDLQDTVQNLVSCPTSCPPIPQVCGNSIIEGTEQCDGTNLSGQTCMSQGYDGGTLACYSTGCPFSPCPTPCTFDTSSCYNQVCGNNIVEGTEVCDGTNLSGQTCISQGYAGGTLACLAGCGAFNTSRCHNDTTYPRVDALTPNGTTIWSLPGHFDSNVTDVDDPISTCWAQLDSTIPCVVGGTGNCSVQKITLAPSAIICRLWVVDITQGLHTYQVFANDSHNNTNVSGIMSFTYTVPVCGNNLIENTEVCDGTNLSGETCVSQGYVGGTLACSAGCLSLNTSGCYNDITGPQITVLIPPSPGNSSVQKSRTLEIHANMTDSISDVDACILDFDGINETMNKTGTGLSVQCKATKTLLDRTDHNYTIYANDTVGNMARNGTWFFTIREPGPPLAQGGTGVPSKPTYNYEVFEGRTYNVTVGDTVTIVVKGQNHTVKLTDVTPGYVAIDIMSPLRLTLTLGEVKDVDVDENGLNDLRVELLYILLPDSAAIKFTQLSEAAPAVPEQPTTPEAPTAPEFVTPTALFTAQQGSLLTFLVFALIAVIVYVMWGKVKGKGKVEKKPSKDEQLRSYIGRERARLHSDEHVLMQLLKSGWKHEQIDVALRKAKRSSKD